MTRMPAAAVAESILASRFDHPVSILDLPPSMVEQFLVNGRCRRHTYCGCYGDATHRPFCCYTVSLLARKGCVTGSYFIQYPKALVVVLATYSCGTITSPTQQDMKVFRQDRRSFNVTAILDSGLTGLLYRMTYCQLSCPKFVHTVTGYTRPALTVSFAPPEGLHIDQFSRTRKTLRMRQNGAATPQLPHKGHETIDVSSTSFLLLMRQAARRLNFRHLYVGPVPRGWQAEKCRRIPQTHSTTPTTAATNNQRLNVGSSFRSSPTRSWVQFGVESTSSKRQENLGSPLLQSGCTSRQSRSFDEHPTDGLDGDSCLRPT
jgi:hypothetical protein